MTTPFAMLFPGQGSQSLGMLNELAQVFPSIPSLFAHASQILNYDLWELTQHGPSDKLNQTQFTQPALLTADIALFQCWQSKEKTLPSMVAGHSLGEYSALVCAGVLHFDDALRLVAERGRLMQDAVSTGKGAMAAIVGLNDEQIISLCHEAARQQILSPANYNSIGQTVIAGEYEAVERALILAKQQGAKIAQIIPVSVPSHCELMKPAAEQLALHLEKVIFQDPKIPIVQNFDAQMVSNSLQIQASLIKQLTQPVRWVETIQNMAAKGIQIFVECGPGKVLSGLNKRIVREIPTYPTETIALLNAALSAIS